MKINLNEDTIFGLWALSWITSLLLVVSITNIGLPASIFVIWALTGLVVTEVAFIANIPVEKKYWDRKLLSLIFGFPMVSLFLFPAVLVIYAGPSILNGLIAASPIIGGIGIFISGCVCFFGINYIIYDIFLKPKKKKRCKRKKK